MENILNTRGKKSPFSPRMRTILWQTCNWYPPGVRCNCHGTLQAMEKELPMKQELLEDRPKS